MPTQPERAGNEFRPSIWTAIVVMTALAALATAATWWVNFQGYTLYSGDAQAHLNIARRVIDSRTPGVMQIGTVWLPLPHLVMIPLAGNDALWASGMAGAIPVSICFWTGMVLFYLALARIFRSEWAGLAGATVLALNPNLIYLQATPMTEAIFTMALGGVLFGCARYVDKPTVGWSALTGFFALAGAMTRYDGWFLLPMVAVFLWGKGGNNRWLHGVVFCAIAGAGPLWWLAHNWWFWGDALEFYWGPYSAKAIYLRQLEAGMSAYPADGNWAVAIQYFATAARLVAGWPFLAIGLAGVTMAAVRGPRWAAALLLTPGVFYLVSMHNGGTPIFVPELWPNAHYNTRYATAVLPALAFGLAALVSVLPPLRRPLGVALGLFLVSAPWMLSPGPESWICWKESAVNSEARRLWLGEAATYLKRMYRPGSGILLSFGDLAGVLQLSGIPLRESLHEGNHPWFRGSVNKAQFFFREEWALCHAGDDVARAMVEAKRAGMPVERVREIRVGNAAPVEIWRRRSDFRDDDLSRPIRLPAGLERLEIPGVGNRLAERDATTRSDDAAEDEEENADTVP